MEKCCTQFDKLKEQWSKIASKTKTDCRECDTHNKAVAKIGVAWSVKIPGKDCSEPAGWEVDIIDTPIGISERTNVLLKWIKNPPFHFYDCIKNYKDLTIMNKLNEGNSRSECGMRNKRCQCKRKISNTSSKNQPNCSKSAEIKNSYAHQNLSRKTENEKCKRDKEMVTESHHKPEDSCSATKRKKCKCNENYKKRKHCSRKRMNVRSRTKMNLVPSKYEDSGDNKRLPIPNCCCTF